MRPPTAHAARPAGFTLIEIVLAMAIMGVICGTIYQFTGTTVQVAGVAMRVDAREQALGGLRRLLAAQFAALPASESAALTGETNDGKNGREDALRLLCPGGSAVLTPDARGLYWATFELRDSPGGKKTHMLILNREPREDDAQASAKQFELPAVSAGGVRTSGAGGLGERPSGWVRLLDGVTSLQFDYFDPRLNSWVDKWNDPTMNPSLVRVRLAMENSGAPYEFVEKVPGGGMPRGALALALNSNIPSPPAGFNVPNQFNGANPGVPSSGGFGANGVNAGRGTAGASSGSTSAPTFSPPVPSSFSPPIAPPTTSVPALPPGLSVPGGTPPVIDPTKPFMAPDTGTGLPPGFQQY